MNFPTSYSKGFSESEDSEDPHTMDKQHEWLAAAYFSSSSRKKHASHLATTIYRHSSYDAHLEYGALYVDAHSTFEDWKINKSSGKYYFSGDRVDSNLEIKKLQQQINELRRAVEILLIDDSPIFESSALYDTKSNNKRIIYILNNLMTRDKHVMLNRVISNVVHKISSPETLFTIYAMLSDNEKSKSNRDIIEEKLNSISPSILNKITKR